MSLLYKLFIPIAIMLGVTFVVVNHISVRIIEQAALEEKAQFLIAHATKEAQDDFTDQDLLATTPSTAIQPQLERYISNLQDPAIFRFKIWDSNGRIVYSDFAQLNGRGNPPEEVKNQFANTPSLPSWKLVEPEEANTTESSFGKYLHITVPIQDNNGDTRYVLEEFAASSFVLNQVSSYNRMVRAVAIAAGAILFMGLYLIIRITIIKPLATLAKNVEVIGQGNLTHPITGGGHDEIGTLSRHFNAMRLKLKSNLEQLDAAKKDVEHQVIDRTKQLQIEQARLQASIDSLTIGFIIIGAEHKLIKANAKLMTMLDLMHAETDIAAIDTKLEGFSLREKVDKALRLRKPAVYRDVSIGAQFYRITIAPIVVGHSEKTTGAVILIEDITEEKALERSRDEFFSIASHELRTPLTVIKGNASLLHEFYVGKVDEAKFTDIVVNMKDSASYLIGVVNQFLDMSRLEQGKISLQPQKLDINRLIRDSVDELLPSATQKKLAIKFDTPDHKIPMVYADPDRTKQVLINLIGNAIKYTTEESITVRTTIEDKDFVSIKVEDSGPGIPQESQHLLFHKFQQASDNIYTRDFTRSTGLGLYICRLIVRAMGGKIFLEKSEPGKGSTFVFTLPVAISIENKEHARDGMMNA